MRRYYFHEAFWLPAHQAGGELPKVIAFYRKNHHRLLQASKQNICME